MTKRRLLSVGAVVLLLLVAIGSAAVWRVAAPPRAGAFYDLPEPLVPGEPGEIIRWEAIDSPSAHVRAWRVLYHSRDLAGADTAVSALIATPDSDAPDGGFPLIAVGHGTIGINRGCAPSIDPFRSTGGGPSSYDFFVSDFVEAGYAVVMADYQGLGPRGDSSYLIGEIEGQNILDSIRAAQAFDQIEVESSATIVGQSQGGHAALFAAQLAPVYAPELDLLGVVAEAPAADLGAIFTPLIEHDERGGVVALTLMTADAWSVAYPDLELDDLLTDRGEGALDNVVKRVCLMTAILGTQLARPSDLLEPGAIELLGSAIAENTPQTTGYAMPVFIAQGTADEVVPAPTNHGFTDRLCAGGVELWYQTYPEIGHFDVVEAALNDVLAWIGDRRAGVPSTTNCSS